MVIAPGRRRTRAVTLLVAGAACAAGVLVPVAAHAANPSDTLLSYDIATGTITKIGTDGSQSTFATGLATGYYGGLAVTASGDTVYATDGPSIVRFSRTGGSGTLAMTVPGASFTDVAVDASGNVYAMDGNSGTSVYELSSSGVQSSFTVSGGYTVASSASGTVYTNDFSDLYSYAPTTHTQTHFAASGRGADSLAVMPDGTVWGARGSALEHFSTSGQSTGTITLPTNFAPGLGASPSGALYVAAGSEVYQVAAGGSSLSPVATTSYTPGDVEVLPPARPAAGTTNPGTTAGAFTLHATRMKPVGSAYHRRVRVTGTGLTPGETYRLKLGKRVVATGTVDTSGTIARQVRLPRCLGGSHRIRLVGSVHHGWAKFTVSRIWPQRCTGLWAH